jgi:hypothetical protein
MWHHSMLATPDDNVLVAVDVAMDKLADHWKVCYPDKVHRVAVQYSLQ